MTTDDAISIIVVGPSCNISSALEDTEAVNLREFHTSSYTSE